MALKVKLTRVGKKNAPKYRIVIAEEHSKRDGKYVESIGFYDPLPAESILKIDVEKLKSWIAKGAQLTDGTYKLLKGHLA